MEVRTALVTGSARRVGRIIAQHLLGAGWQVIVHARDADAAERAATELGALAGIGADLAAAEAAAQLIERTREITGGRLDLLVNNASTFVYRTPSEITQEDWAASFDVNARAPHFLTQAAAPLLRDTRGMVVNVSDRAAHEHWTTFPTHAASKAALESLTLSWAKALAPDVRVNALCPGTILAPDDAPPNWSEYRTDLTPMPTFLAALDALIDDPARSGEIVLL
jgi:pteridine reductase